MDIIIYLFFLIPLFVLGRVFYHEWLQTHKLDIEWKPNNDQVATDMLKADIVNAKDRILIYGGTTDNIYSKPEILDALREKNIPVEMIFEDENVANSTVKKLSEEKKNFSLFTTKGKICCNHFRVIDYNYVYFEKIHKPKEETRYYKRLYNTRFAPAIFANKFRKIQITSEPIW